VEERSSRVLAFLRHLPSPSFARNASYTCVVAHAPVRSRLCRRTLLRGQIWFRGLSQHAHEITTLCMLHCGPWLLIFRFIFKIQNSVGGRAEQSGLGIPCVIYQAPPIARNASYTGVVCNAAGQKSPT